MRARGPALALATLVGAASLASAQDTVVEWSLGGGIANRFSRHEPFTFDDLTFAGPYLLCPPQNTADECLFNGLGDASYGLEVNYPAAAVAGVDVRRSLGGPLWIDLGVLGGAGVRERRLLRVPLAEVVRTRPEEPDALVNAYQNNNVFRSDGLGAFGYLHAGLRLEHEFGRHAAPGSRSALKRVFVEGGGGWIPLVPGGEDAGLGRPTAVHGLVGLALRRGLTGGAVTLSARYIRALKSADEAVLIDSKPHWLVFQVGFIAGR